MGVTIATMRAAVNTSTGNQNFTTSKCGGLTPKAALLIMTTATADATAADGAQMSIGFTDGTTSYCMSFSSVHGVTTTDTHSAHVNKPMEFYTPGSGTVVATCSFNAWLTDGIQLNWTDAPESAFLLTIMFFCGSDVTAKVGHSATDLQAQDTAFDITTVGFEPELVFCLSSLNLEGATTDNVNQTRMAFGIATWDLSSVIEQRAWGSQSRNGQTGSIEMGAYLASNRCSVEHQASGGFRGALEAGSFDASGFSVTPRGSSWDGDLYWLALEFSGLIGIDVGTISTPTSTQEVSYEGPAFTPQAVILGTTLCAAVDTNEADAESGTVGISLLDGTDQFSCAWTEEFNQTTTDNQSLVDDLAANVPLDTGANGLIATSSFDSLGFNLNYTTVHSAATQWFYLALESLAEGAGDLDRGVMRGVGRGIGRGV